jgi:hypothetical protein
MVPDIFAALRLNGVAPVAHDDDWRDAVDHDDDERIAPTAEDPLRGLVALAAVDRARVPFTDRFRPNRAHQARHGQGVMTAAVTPALCAWPEGQRVEREIAEPVRGVVMYVDEDGWIVWRADDRHVHVSRPEVLRRIR